ncbi:helix-turn-helix domain-containing protein [Streptomyces sp. NPDC087659]|uniref:helix-turn-helix domain-containing protein n=1 Tax=Streptomyces sp. NPDC087659 TaxID=3365801 RepID=UPI00382AA0E4
MSAPIADVNEFAVLMMLAEKAGEDGCSSFPSRQTISERTRVDPRTVLRALQRLEERRLIAKGDQRAAEYLRKDRRPVVYDLLIPVSWYSRDQLAKVNADRARRGLEPLSPELRPDIEQAPEKSRRSDLKKPNPRRSRKSHPPETSREETPRGVSETSREETPRGVSETGTGCLEDTNGVSQRHPREVLEPVLESSSSARTDETELPGEAGDVTEEEEDRHDYGQTPTHGVTHGVTGGRAAAPACQEIPSPRPAATPADGQEAEAVRQFVATLPRAREIGRSEAERMAGLVDQAVAAGWTHESLHKLLAGRCGPNVTMPGRLYLSVLTDLPAPPTSKAARPVPAGRCAKHPDFAATECVLCGRPAETVATPEQTTATAGQIRQQMRDRREAAA